MKNRLHFKSSKLNFSRYRSKKLSNERFSSDRCTKKCFPLWKGESNSQQQLKAARKRRKLSTRQTSHSVKKSNKCKSNSKTRCNLASLSLNLCSTKKKPYCPKRRFNQTLNLKTVQSKSFPLSAKIKSWNFNLKNVSDLWKTKTTRFLINKTSWKRANQNLNSWKSAMNKRWKALKETLNANTTSWNNSTSLKWRPKVAGRSLILSTRSKSTFIGLDSWKAIFKRLLRTKNLKRGTSKS